MVQKEYYEPPKQGAVGQIFDAVFVLIIIYCVLLLPIVLGLTAGETTTNIPETVTWETLNQNEVMQAQWEKLDFTPETAAEYICTRYQYVINPVSLVLTALIVIAYFIIVLRFSNKEYQDVINEKFN